MINLTFYVIGLQPGTAASALPAAGTVKAQYQNPSDSLPELTLGEKMSQILKDQTEQLTKKVRTLFQYILCTDAQIPYSLGNLFKYNNKV